MYYNEQNRGHWANETKTDQKIVRKHVVRGTMNTVITSTNYNKYEVSARG